MNINAGPKFGPRHRGTTKLDGIDIKHGGRRCEKQGTQLLQSLSDI